MDFALIKTGTSPALVSTFPSTTGRVDLPGVGQVSPPVDGWSGDGFRIATVQGTIPEGNRSTGAVLVNGVPQWTYEPEPVERRRVDKWLIIGRVSAAGKGPEAKALLNMSGNEDAYFRWMAPVESVFFDDPETVGMILALGLVPEEILAPPTELELASRVGNGNGEL